MGHLVAEHQIHLGALPDCFAYTDETLRDIAEEMAVKRTTPFRRKLGFFVEILTGELEVIPSAVKTCKQKHA
jgi:hypothetical protein